jgi:C4-dicarboxylate-specific signal transduction histidine kinase
MSVESKKTKAKLLIAEDTPIQGKKLKFYLEKFGYDVDWAKDGKEGWEMFQAHDDYDLVITDVQMPHMDGLAFLEHIKNKSERSHIPVIVLTTLKDDDTLLTALKSGASEFLNKPFRPQELKLRAQNLVSLSKFQHMMLNENESLSQQLIEKNQILEKNFSELQQAHDEMKSIKAKLIHSSKKSALGVMGAGVAHEINNPLAIIDGYNERLGTLLEEAELQKDQIKKVNQKIKRSTDRIRDVVLHLKEFAQGSNEEEAEEKVFDLKDMLTKLSNFFGNRMDEMGVKVNFSLPEEPVFVKGVPASIEHALFNIVHNAVDAVENTAQKNVSIKMTCEGDAVEISVEDTGVGIPESALFKIYDPFFTTKEIGRGVGLGLSVARSYLEEHGAQIDCESEEEKGTVFTIKFPKQEAA